MPKAEVTDLAQIVVTAFSLVQKLELPQWSSRGRITWNSTFTRFLSQLSRLSHARAISGLPPLNLDSRFAMPAPPALE